MNRIYTIVVLISAFALSNANAQTYPVRWTDLIGVSNSNELLTKTAASGSWTNASATSSNYLAPNADGSIEFSFSATQIQIQIGFVTNNFSAIGPDVFENGLGVGAGGVIYIYEVSASLPSFGNYTPGDVFKISREGTQIKYYRNGTVLRASTVNAALPLWVRANVLSNGQVTPAVTASFDAQLIITPTITGTVTGGSTGSISLNVQGGKAPYTYSWVGGGTSSSLTGLARTTKTVTVTDADGRSITKSFEIGYKFGYRPPVGATESNGSLTRIASGSGWDSGADVSNTTTNTAWMEFVVMDYNSFYAIGIGGATGYILNSLRNGIIINTNHNFTVTEDTYAYPQGAYRVGDVFRIERTVTQVIYSRNGVAFRTVTAPSNNVIIPKVVLNQGTSPHITSSIDAHLNAIADVHGTSAADGTGSIAVNAYGGVSPYTYSWSGGNGTSNSITNKIRNTYTVTITDAEGRAVSKSYSIGYNQIYTDLYNNSTVTDGIITRTVNGYNGGGITSNVLSSVATQGWFEFVIPAGPPTQFIVGTFRTENGWLPSDLRMGISYDGTTNAARLYSVDPLSGQVDLGITEPGDVLRAERSGGNLVITRNGTVLKTVALTSFDWRVKVTVASGSGPRVTSSFDAKPIIVADVNGSYSNSNSTGISTTVTGGKAPYTYSWNSGETTANISNKPRGIYTLTVTDSEGRTAARTYNAAYKNTWYNQVNTSLNSASNGLKKNDASTTWNSSALGTGILPSGTSTASIEFVTKDVSSHYAIGFSYQDTAFDPALSALYFGFEISIDGSILVREINTYFNVGVWLPGDVFKIERNGGTMYYSRNGAVVRTVTASTLELKPRVLIKQGAAPPVISTEASKLSLITSVTGTEKQDSTGSISIIPRGGVGSYSYSWNSEYGAMTETVSHIENKRRGRYTVTVTDSLGTSVQRSYYLGYKQHYTWLWGVAENSTDNGLTRTASGTGWGQGANSYNVLPANTDGFVEWIVKEDGGYYNAGFGAKGTGTDVADFRNGIIISSLTGRATTNEANVNSVNSNAQPGDVFRISREGSNVVYYRNGTAIRTIASNAALDFYVKVVINSGGSPPMVTSFDTTPGILPVISGTGVANNTVNITTAVEGGTAPYTYLWNTGETTPGLSNKPRGVYTLKVKDASGRSVQRTYEVRYKNYLTNATNIAPKSGYPEFYTSSSSVAGANSSNILPSGVTGNNWIEWVHQSNTNSYQVGFGLNDYNYGSADFLYSLNFNNLGAVNYNETAASVFLTSSEPGDVYRISREDNNIKYYKNGVVIRTVAIGGDFELRPKFFVPSGTVPAIIVSVDSQIIPVATVTGTSGQGTTGSIAVTTLGGSNSYTYSWSPSNEATGSITNKARGPYTLTVTDTEGRSAIRTYEIGYRPIFLSASNVTTGANSITKVNSVLYDGGATSSGYLLPNENGWVEMIVPQATAATTYRTGFSYADGSYATTALRYAFQMDGTKSIVAMEGTTSYPFGNILPGDVLRIERNGSNIIYKRNGVQKRTVSTDPTLELHWKAAIATGTVPMFNTSFDSKIAVSPTVTGTSIGNTGGGISLVASGASPGYSYTWSPNVSTTETTPSLSKGTYSVTVKDTYNRQTSLTFAVGSKPSWTNVTGANINGQSLTKTAAGGWNAGALTLAPLDPGKSGSLEFAITDNTSSFIIGYTTVLNSFQNSSFSNSIFVDPSTSSIYSIENSTTTYLSSYQVGDVLSIERAGSNMVYKRNGVTKKTSTVNNSLALRVKSAINTGSSPGISSSFEIDDMSISINNLAFQYKYDKNQRLIKKKLPGADWVYMVYDKRDRLVLTQDGGMRVNQQWQFFKYDDLDRPVSSGMITTSTPASQEDKQSEVDAFYNGSSVYGESRGDVVHGYTNYTYPSVPDTSKYWTVTYYDDYDWLVKTGPYSDSLKFSPDEFPAADFPDVVEPAALTQVPGMVTGTKVKVLDGGPMYLSSVTYYDAKGRVIQTVEENYKLGTDRTTNVLDFTGRIVRSKTKHIDRDVTWRDKKYFSEVGRMIYNSSPAPTFPNCGAVATDLLPAGKDGWIEATVNSPAGGWRIGFSAANSNDIDYAIGVSNSAIIVYTGSTFAGIPGLQPKKGDVVKIRRVGSVIRFYRNNVEIGTPISNANVGKMMIRAQLYFNGGTAFAIRSSASTVEHTTWRRFDYDLGGRLVNTWHKLDKEPEVLLSQNKYDVIGRLKDKNLHSIDNGATARQSIDYRYDIHGWLTSINGSEMIQDERNSDLPGQEADLFGFDLLYDKTVAGINDNAGMFNGNISAMKWGTNRGGVVENAYKFDYDTLGRFKSAAFRQKTPAWAASDNYSESGYKYDRNGNITNLTRNGKNGTAIDVLSYVYGTGTEKLNSLLRVTDSGPTSSKGEGFVDGPNTDSDYSYDPNGNLIGDKNKAIGSISYIYPFNLPSKVTRGLAGSSAANLNLVYDANGRKLAQAAAYDIRPNVYGVRRNTDYAGEFLYEDGILQAIHHEEGRIAMATRERFAFNDGSTTTGTTAARSSVSVDPVSLHDGRSYLKVLENANATTPGIDLATDIPVEAGERYLLKVKGYTATAIATSPYLKAVITQGGQTTDLTNNSVQLAVNADADSWVEQVFIIPDNALEASLTVGVYNPSTIATQPTFYIDEFELVRVSSISPEYQYDLKDHLGNVRVSFGTKTRDVVRATYEMDSTAKDEANFHRYQLAKLVKSHLFDHTKDANAIDTIGYAQRLNGSTNERIGLAKSLAVMPGDRVKAEVFAKYVSGDTVNWKSALLQIISFLASPATAPANTIIDGGGYASSGSTSLGITPIGHAGDPDNGAPKAYLNFIFINKNYDPASLRTSYKPITTAAAENGTDKLHQQLTLDEAITEEGYVYVYLSNDNPKVRDVYFDDFKVEHIKNPIIQSQDYYPFGLTFNSYSREDALDNKWKFQGQQHVDALDLNWDSFKWRNHQPDIGRFFNLDPLAEKYVDWSPYVFSGNQVTSYIELEGLAPVRPPRSGNVMYQSQAAQNYRSAVRRDINRTSYEYSNRLENGITPKIDMTPTKDGIMTGMMLDIYDYWSEMQQKRAKNLELRLTRNETENTNVFGDTKTESVGYSISGKGANEFRAMQKAYNDKANAIFDEQFAAYATKTLGKDFNSLSADEQSKFRVENLGTAAVIRFGVEKRLGPSPLHQVLNLIGTMIQQGGVKQEVKRDRQPMIGPR